jgi:hypothetical protein
MFIQTEEQTALPCSTPWVRPTCGFVQRITTILFECEHLPPLPLWICLSHQSSTQYCKPQSVSIPVLFHSSTNHGDLVNLLHACTHKFASSKRHGSCKDHITSGSSSATALLCARSWVNWAVQAWCARVEVTTASKAGIPARGERGQRSAPCFVSSARGQMASARRFSP